MDIQQQRKKILCIVSIGTRGDVQPYIALGYAAKATGFQVKIATEARLRPLVESFDLEYAQIDGDSTGLLFEQTPEVQEVLQKGQLFPLMRLTKAWEAKFDKRAILDSYLTALSGADLIVSGGLSVTPSFCVAEKLNVPWLPMLLGPTLPTAEFPIWPLKSIAICSCMNRWTYSFLFDALWMQEKASINAWRKESLGLPSLSRGIVRVLDQQQIPVLIACSRLLCPSEEVPRDYPLHAHLKGFMFVPPVVPGTEDLLVPLSLRNFVAIKHQPIVYFGFGSMPVPDPTFLANIALTCCQQLGARGVVCAGWSSPLNEMPVFAQNRDILLMVPFAPHDWLFPQMSCLVHHCGVGTMAAAMRAGVPSVPCPFMLDQPHNAKRLVELNLAPCVVPYNDKMTASQLGAAVGIVLSNPDKFRASCARVKAIVDDEANAAFPAFLRVMQMRLDGWDKCR